ncbi:MAG: glycine--tRNA ligase subunit beta, partial [Burkholderiaceae bacterium]|nr:glycine--tRNA ligase subunit beta [Burkholderiaceae bacterium]
MTVASLLIELQTEELPPKALLALARAFADGIEAGLRARHLLREDSRATAFATPRRLAVHITHVKSRADDRPVRQKLMPLAVAQDKAKNWTAAFLKKLEALGHGHLARLSPGERAGDASLVVEYDGKGEAVFLHRVAAGQTLLEQRAALQSGAV